MEIKPQKSTQEKIIELLRNSESKLMSREISKELGMSKATVVHALERMRYWEEVNYTYKVFGSAQYLYYYYLD